MNVALEFAKNVVARKHSEKDAVAEIMAAGIDFAAATKLYREAAPVAQAPAAPTPIAAPASVIVSPPIPPTSVAVAEAPAPKQSFHQFEVERLQSLLNATCFQLYDPSKIQRTVEEWRNGIADSTIEFHEESTMSKFSIGTKVHRRAGNYGTGTGAVAFGVVAYNVALTEGTFDDLRASAPEDTARWRYLAGLTFVTWFYQDGTYSTSSWHTDEELVEVSS